MTRIHPKKPQEEAKEREAEPYLLSAGWRRHDDGWKHRELHFPWPTGAAYQLQKEADNNCQDPVHRQLRGE